MTGKLLGPSTAEKSKNPPSNEASSDDEKKMMLTEGHKYMDDNPCSSPKGRKEWPFCIYRHPLPNGIQQRYVLCAMAHFGFLLLYIMRSTMSVAIVRMTTPYAVIKDGKPTLQTDFNWTLKEQGLLLSSFFIGYILTQILGGYWAIKRGGRFVFGYGLMLASIVSAFTPLMGKVFGFYGLLFSRVLCGLFEGVTYPAIHAMWNHWAPPKERSTLVSGAFSGAYIGAAIIMAQSINTGTSGSSFSWQELFYVSGIVSMMWSFIWFMWGAEYPDIDPMVSDREMKYLAETVGDASSDIDRPVPWCKILLSHRVWAISICHFAANWGFYTILTELPTFLAFALRYDSQSLGRAAAFPFIAMAISAIFGGVFVDMTLHRCLNTTNTRKVTVAVTFIAQMMFFFLAGKATENYEYVNNPGKATECVAYIAGGLFFCGLSWAGFSANHLDIAPDFASVLLGITNTFGTIPGILTPIVTSMFVKDKDDAKSWSPVFLFAGYIYLAAALFYVLFGSGERQDWADANECVKLKSVKKQTSTGDAESGSE